MEPKAALITVDDFYAIARSDRLNNPNWRYGQSLFNTLARVRPDLADKIRATDADPFHAHGGTDDERLHVFRDFISKNW